METEKIKLNIGICDDQAPMVTRLEKMCREILEERYLLQIDTALTAADLLAKENPFQIALLDVQLLETTGIELARQIILRNPRCRIIFVSGYLQAVSEVYEVPHFCFVLKDQLEEEMPKFLMRAAELCAQEAGEIVLVASGRKMLEITLADIVLIERRGHWSYLNMTDGTIVQTKEKLADLLARIRSGNFLRCHVSYVINLQFVASLEGRTFTMRTGAAVPISRPNEGECRDTYFRYLGEKMM